MVWWRVRRWIRRNTAQIPEKSAIVWRRRLNVAYAVITWNLIFMMGYTFYKGKLDWAEYHGLEKMKGSPAQQFAYQLDIPRAKVLRFDGFTKIDEFTIENRKDLEEFPELALSVSDKMKDQKILREMKEKAAAGKDKELLEE